MKKMKRVFLLFLVSLLVVSASVPTLAATSYYSVASIKGSKVKYYKISTRDRKTCYGDRENPWCRVTKTYNKTLAKGCKFYVATNSRGTSYKRISKAEFLRRAKVSAKYFSRKLYAHVRPVKIGMKNGKIVSMKLSWHP